MTVNHFSNQETTIVGMTRMITAMLYAGLGGVGLILGYFLPRIAAWVVTLPMVPFRGPIELILSFDGIWLKLALAVLGLVAGFVLAAIAVKETLTLHMTDQEVRLAKDDHKQTVTRAEVSVIFMDGKQLVMLGTDRYERVRIHNDQSVRELEAAFRKHGYPWSAEGDPYKEKYRRWVPDTPDVPPGVNAVMKAREKALERKENADIEDLRQELAKLGYIVRDEETRQYWRQV